MPKLRRKRPVLRPQLLRFPCSVHAGNLVNTTGLCELVTKCNCWERDNEGTALQVLNLALEK